MVGASRAGLFAVEAARRAGHRGRITLVGAEPHLPYDRPPLSKEYLTCWPAEPSDPTYRAAAALAGEFDVDVRLGAPADGLDLAARTVSVGAQRIPFDALVIATGATPRPMPAADGLAGVRTLRTLDDARAIRETWRGECGRTVVVGAGFVGLETAAAARERGAPVTVVEALPVPLVRAAGEVCGQACARLHDLQGTDLRTGVTIASVEGRGRVERVGLSDGSTLDTALLVVGIGVDPATGWLEGSGLALDDGVVCDETLAASAPGVYAAGDVARWHNPTFGIDMRLEHWTSAAEQGRIAAQNAVSPGTATAYATVPYFWSDQYGCRIQFVGVTAADEVSVLVDNLPERSYLAVYRTGTRLTGAFGINETRRIPRLRKMIGQGASVADALEAIGAAAVRAG
ncbi:MAG TPA: FAD-dependent oxidoreductase [Jatrophihabitans sp.]|nr:FAD-dependent oxidoreductase [Jatrophihabitans sp.]